MCTSSINFIIYKYAKSQYYTAYHWQQNIFWSWLILQYALLKLQTIKPKFSFNSEPLQLKFWLNFQWNNLGLPRSGRGFIGSLTSCAFIVPLHYYILRHICICRLYIKALTNHPLFAKSIFLNTDLDLLACSLGRYCIKLNNYSSNPNCSKVDNFLQLVNHCPVGKYWQNQLRNSLGRDLLYAMNSAVHTLNNLGRSADTKFL